MRGKGRTCCAVLVEDEKAELAALAAREVAGTGWLPEVLRLSEEQVFERDQAA